MGGEKAAAIVLVTLAWLMFIVVMSKKDAPRKAESARQISGSQRQVGTPAPMAEPEHTNPSSPVAKEPLSRAAQARVDLADSLQAALRRQGRLLAVSATGDKYDTLEFSSGLIFEGSNTLQAVHRETLLCDDCLLLYKKLGFKQIVIRGSEYHLAYSL